VPELAALVKAYAGSLELKRAYVGETLVAQMRTNLCTNPSFELDVAGWLGSGATIAKSNAEYHYRNWSMLVTPSTATGGATYTFPTVPTQVYTMSGWFMSPTARQAQVLAPGAGSGVQDLPAGVWTRIRVTVAATAASTTVSFLSVTTTDVFYLDGVLIEDGPLLGPEFDGETLAAVGHGPGRWTGAPDASTSKLWGMPLT
jgi:hypothetical protein